MAHAITHSPLCSAHTLASVSIDATAGSLGMKVHDGAASLCLAQNAPGHRKLGDLEMRLSKLWAKEDAGGQPNAG